MKGQIDILKTAIAERRDLKIDSNIRDATLQLDDMFAISISSI